MASLLMLNGPNLDLLGQREPGVYGRITLAQIESDSKKLAGECGHQLACFQSNAEHELVERVHQAAREHVDFI
ncbi:MAG: type II 3-dehydroquinate dehydratase, partial [Gammaproteobacteria bacterium]